MKKEKIIKTILLLLTVTIAVMLAGCKTVPGKLM